MSDAEGEEKEGSSFGSDRDDAEYQDPNEPVGEVIRKPKSHLNLNVARAKMLPGKERSILDSIHQTVCVDFYMADNEEDKLYMHVPRMTSINSWTPALPDDYADFPGRYSGWYTDTEKRTKGTSKEPPLVPKEFVCDFPDCKWSFGLLPRLLKHKETHMDAGTFACQVCHCLFNHQYNMYHHWRNSCTQLTGRRSDCELANAAISGLRNYVLCVMGMNNRAQLYHVTGGSMFLPSPQFIEDRFNVNLLMYSSPCHLCSLQVPTKYVECHGDVHRGRYRIDGKIHGDYYCHICSRIFRDKHRLYEHWKHYCKELIAFTADEVRLDDDEIATLAWLVLQQTVPYAQIDTMAKNTKQMLERWGQEHAKKHQQKGIYTDFYYHFPQEIFPLNTQVKYNVIDDSLLIRDQTEINTSTKVLAVHGVNMLAFCSPDFYASGLMWHQLCSTPEVSGSDQVKGTYRVILRYSMKDSIISTYKFTYKTCPRLRPENLNYQTEKQDYTCTTCENVKKNKNILRFTSEARLRDHTKKVHSRQFHLSDYCPLCRRIMYLKSHEEHWEYDCKAIAHLIEDPEDRKCVDRIMVDYLSKKVFGAKNKIKLELLRPASMIEEKGTDGKDSYFTWNNGENYEKADSQRDEVQIKITNLEDINHVRSFCKRSFDTAIMRHTLRVNPIEFEPPQYMYIAICPHCGCRVHQDLLFDHLHFRHFWPDKDPVRNAFAKWRASGFSQPYASLSKIVETIKNHVPPLMSKESYSACVKYNFGENQKPLEMFENSCQTNSNFHTINAKTIKLAATTDAQLKSDSSESVVPMGKTEVADNWSQCWPEISKVGDEGEIVDQFPLLRLGAHEWNEEDPNIVLNNPPKVDPLTKNPLPSNLAERMIKIDEKFFGKYRKTAYSNGIYVDSLTDFFRDGSTARPNHILRPECDTEAGMTHRTEADVEKALEDDVKVMEEHEQNNHDEVYQDSDDTDVEDEEQPFLCTEKKNVAEDEAADLRREKVTARERRKQRKDTRDLPEPRRYDKSKFAAMDTCVNPLKVKQLKWLPTVNYGSTYSMDQTRDNSRPLPLSQKLENTVSNFRVGAQNTDILTRKDLAKAGNSLYKLAQSLNDRDKEGSVQYEDVRRKEKHAYLEQVMDNEGTAYIGGIILPKEFPKGELEKFYITKGVQAKKMQTFCSSDRQGEFKFTWPVEPTVNISEVKDRKLSRFKLVPLSKMEKISKVPEPEIPGQEEDSQDAELRLSSSATSSAAANRQIIKAKRTVQQGLPMVGAAPGTAPPPRNGPVQARGHGQDANPSAPRSATVPGTRPVQGNVSAQRNAPPQRTAPAPGNRPIQGNASVPGAAPAQGARPAQGKFAVPANPSAQKSLSAPRTAPAPGSRPIQGNATGPGTAPGKFAVPANPSARRSLPASRCAAAPGTAPAQGTRPAPGNFAVPANPSAPRSATVPGTRPVQGNVSTPRTAPAPGSIQGRGPIQGNSTGPGTAPGKFAVPENPSVRRSLPASRSAPVPGTAPAPGKGPVPRNLSAERNAPAPGPSSAPRTAPAPGNSPAQLRSPVKERGPVQMIASTPMNDSVAGPAPPPQNRPVQGNGPLQGPSRPIAIARRSLQQRPNGAVPVNGPASGSLPGSALVSGNQRVPGKYPVKVIGHIPVNGSAPGSLPRTAPAPGNRPVQSKGPIQGNATPSRPAPSPGTRPVPAKVPVRVNAPNAFAAGSTPGPASAPGTRPVPSEFSYRVIMPVLPVNTSIPGPAPPPANGPIQKSLSAQQNVPAAVNSPTPGNTTTPEISPAKGNGPVQANGSTPVNKPIQENGSTPGPSRPIAKAKRTVPKPPPVNGSAPVNGSEPGPSSKLD